MSIVLAVSTSQPTTVPTEAEGLLLLIMLALTVASPLIARAAGGFRPPGALGSGRFGSCDSLMRFLVPLLVAVVIIILAANLAYPLASGLATPEQRNLAAGMLAML